MHLPFFHRSNAPRGASGCESSDPANTLTSRLNALLNSSGESYTLSLCPGEQYFLTAPLNFAAPYQEISTAGYPTDSTRAMLVVNGTNQTTAVNGQCDNCDGVKLRNVQVNGARLGGPPMSGGANIEMGGKNADQVIEFVHSYDPRGWSCLHLDEGSNLSCTGATVQNNDIGPAGSQSFQQWADGISVACRDSVVRNNMVNNPTDGGIVLFGAPGTRVENNTIWVETQTLLGGINMVDVEPFGGDYNGVVVTNNSIAGGFASSAAEGSETKGTSTNDTVIKIGIAIGPRTWFGTKYGKNVSAGAVVQDNQLTGAFSYGIAMSSAKDFTLENNVLFGNTSFIGALGPNCSANDPYPSPAAFIADWSTVNQSTVQVGFASVSYDTGLTCVVAPGGSYWPFDSSPSYSSGSPINPPEAGSTATTNKPSAGTKAGIAVGVIVGVLAVAAITWFFWRRAVRRSQLAKPHRKNSTLSLRQKI